jgi:hypothetical protein
MKDFAVRVWDSDEKKMIYITDLYFFKEQGIHTIGKNGNNNRFKDPIMLASPHWDKKNDARLYENDVVECFYCRESEGYGVVRLDDHHGWVVEKARSCTWQDMYDFLERHYFVKVGDIYSNPDIIPAYKKQLKEKDEADKREKELRCLEELKAKYEVNA